MPLMAWHVQSRLRRRVMAAWLADRADTNDKRRCRGEYEERNNQQPDEGVPQSERLHEEEGVIATDRPAHDIVLHHTRRRSVGESSRSDANMERMALHVLTLLKTRPQRAIKTRAPPK